MYPPLPSRVHISILLPSPYFPSLLESFIIGRLVLEQSLDKAILSLLPALLLGFLSHAFCILSASATFRGVSDTELCQCSMTLWMGHSVSTPAVPFRPAIQWQNYTMVSLLRNCSYHRPPAPHPTPTPPLHPALHVGPSQWKMWVVFLVGYSYWDVEGRPGWRRWALVLEKNVFEVRDQ